MKIIIPQGGFTLVEIMAVIVVMVILALISWPVSAIYIQRANDDERASDNLTISRSFETYYRNMSSSSGVATYPSSQEINDASQLKNIVTDSQSLIAPQELTTSLSATTQTETPYPATNQYIYQPYTTSDSICKTSSDAPCVRFLLFYHTETDNKLVVIQSTHQQ